MNRHEGMVAGILGTVIIHLAAAIVFVSLRLHTLRGERANDFPVIIEEFELYAHIENDIVEALIDDDPNISDTEAQISNIVRNLANTEDDPVIDPAEYQDRIKEQMIESGLLDEENFIDQWRRLEEMAEADAVIEEQVEEEKREAETSEEPPVNYQGPTRVYYHLENRSHISLPIPVYKCEGGGKVTTTIEVSRSGMVSSVKIDTENTTTTDACLLETALRYSRVARFNIDLQANPRQQGTITYHFVAQQ